MVVLGFGGGDPLAETYMPLLEALPRSQIYTAVGGSRMDDLDAALARNQNDDRLRPACPIDARPV